MIKITSNSSHLGILVLCTKILSAPRMESFTEYTGCVRSNDEFR